MLAFLASANATMPLAAQPPVRGRPVVVPTARVTRPAWTLADSADADAVVRVVIENGPQATLVGLGRDTLILLPVRQLFGMFEIAITVDAPGKRLAGLTDPDLPAVGFDTDARRLIGRDSTVSFRAEEIAWQQGELFVTPALLARALRVRADVDLGALTVAFLGVQEMPVMRRLERMRQRTIAWRSNRGLPPFAMIEDQPKVFDGAVMDWQFASPLDQPSKISSARIGLGAQLLGGGVELQQQQFGAEPFLKGETTWSWTRAWHGERAVRQLGFGAVATAGRRPRAINGAVLTNVPYFRPSDYANEWLGGTLPVGWELEIQRYGAPVGTARPDAHGAWRFNVPTSYGPNEIELFAYGPGGASRRWRENVVVPVERLQRGKLEYVLAAGACRFEVCEKAATVDLRYGLTDWITVQGGTNEFQARDGSRISNPFALASIGILRSLNVTAEHVAGGLSKAEIDFQPTMDLRATLGVSQFDTSASSRFVNSARVASRLEARVFWRPLESRPGWWTAATLSREERAGVATTNEQVTASMTRGPVRLQGSLLFGQTEFLRGGTAALTQQEEAVIESTVLSPWNFTRGLYGRGSVLINADGSLAQASARLLNSFSRRLRLEAGLQWVRGLATPIVTLQLQANLPTFQLVTQTQAVDGQIVGAQTFSGSAQYDVARRHLQVGNDFANGRGLGNGGVEGELYLDVNGNGRRDPGESGIPNVHVTIGSQQVTTDAHGWFAMGTLLPYVPTMVEIDTVSLPNPMWMIDKGTFGVVPRPNSYLRLSIPVRPGGGIVGVLEYSDRARGPAGAEVEVLNIETHDLRRTVTYSDGSFEAYKLRPGTYEVTPSNATLRRAGARRVPVRVVVPANNEASFVESVSLPLVPEVIAPMALIESIVVPTPPLTLAPDTARRLSMPAPAGRGRSLEALLAPLRAAARAMGRAPALAPPLARRGPAPSAVRPLSRAPAGSSESGRARVTPPPLSRAPDATREGVRPNATRPNAARPPASRVPSASSESARPVPSAAATRAPSVTGARARGTAPPSTAPRPPATRTTAPRTVVPRGPVTRAPGPIGESARPGAARAPAARAPAGSGESARRATRAQAKPGTASSAKSGTQVPTRPKAAPKTRPTGGAARPQ